MALIIVWQQSFAFCAQGPRAADRKRRRLHAGPDQSFSSAAGVRRHLAAQAHSGAARLAILPEPNTLPDSSVIADYLENKFPTPALFPKRRFARARALWFEEYVDGGVFPVMGAGLFFERVVKKFQRGVTDAALCARTSRKACRLSSTIWKARYAAKRFSWMRHLPLPISRSHP